MRSLVKFFFKPFVASVFAQYAKMYRAILLFAVGTTAFGMVFDNRYFPLIQEPYITISGLPSHLRADLFVTTASSANGPLDQHVGIPEMFGNFDLSLLGFAFNKVGLFDPLPPILLSSPLPYIMTGKLQTQGISFSLQYQFHRWISAGFYVMAMQSNSSIDFTFNRGQSSALLSPSDIIALDATRREMFQELGLACNHVHQSGFGDIDGYIRFGDRWEYVWKFRSLEAGARLGVLFPSGVKKNIFEPASVPFGGNGFWGVYASVDGEFEIREDWKVGVTFRVSKRLPKTVFARMPVATEQPLFGVLTGNARINPGWTGIVTPYVSFENLRDGLGARLQYTMIAHQEDSWEDKCCSSMPSNIAPLQKTSGWSSEYITLTGFYDFGKMKVERGRDPIILLSWYIPTALLVANRSVRSFKVSLGVEYEF